MPTAITHDPVFTTPVSSTNTAVVRWSGTAGSVLQNSGVLIDGSNNITGIGTIASGAITSSGAIIGTQVDILAAGDLRLQDSTGGQYVALEAAGTTTTHTLTFPATQGSASTVLTNNGSGALTWAAATTSFIGVRVENSSNQAVANNSVVKLTFDASVTKFDTDTMHSSSNADRITFTTAGYYWCGISYMWSGHATGRRNIWVSSTLAAGGGNTLVRQTISPSTADEQHNTISFIYQFAAGDFIEWYAHQTSGTSLNIMADNESSAVAMAYKIG